MASWAERREQARREGEQAKLLTLRYLSEPENLPHGQILTRIRGAISDAGADIQSYTLREMLKEMAVDGLVEIGGSHPAHGNIKKPYRITGKGRDHLERAENKSPPVGGPEQGQEIQDVAARRSAPLLRDLSNDFLERLPQDWTALVMATRLQKLSADFLRGLPEFQGGGEERIQEVSRALADAIGLPARQRDRGEAERSGR